MLKQTMDGISGLADKEILVLVVQVTTRIRRGRIFFLQVALRKKGKNQVPTSYLQDSPSCYFCPTSRSSQESERFFYRRATYKGTYVEADESARAGLSPKKKGNVRKKRRRPRKARRWLREGKVPCVLNQEFLFLVPEYLGSERSVSFEVLAPTRLILRGSHV